MTEESKKYRVAILLAGQARTYKICLGSIVDFFSNTKTEGEDLEVEVDYFMHTWDTDTWLEHDSDKNKPIYYEQFPAYIEKKFIEDTVKSLKGFKVEQYDKIKPHRVWGGILYSSYTVNQLKCDYEYKKGFTYDLVIRTRPDIVFPPGQRFPFNPFHIAHRCIHVPFMIFKMEQELYTSNVDDVIYMGDSATMNTASKLYQYAGSRVGDPPLIGKYKESRISSPDCFLGPGTFMSRHISLLNISSQSLPDWNWYTVVRKSALDLNLNYKDNYDQIVELNKKFYQK